MSEPWELTPEERHTAILSTRTINGIVDTYDSVARAAQKKLLEWMEEPCPHVHRVFATRPMRACDVCMSDLRAKLESK